MPLAGQGGLATPSPSSTGTRAAAPTRRGPGGSQETQCRELGSAGLSSHVSLGSTGGT